MTLIEAILSEDLVSARELLSVRINELFEEKLENKKLEIASNLYEANIQKMGRTKLIRMRVRNGKVQRRKRLSAVKGYTFRSGRMVRMSPQERLHRKRAARFTKIKIRAKKSVILRKRRMSLNKRRAMGLR